MPKKADALTTVGTEVREALKKAVEQQGWTAARITHEMNKRGHLGWTTSVVAAALRDRLFTVDEAVSLLGLLKGNALAVLRRVDAVAEMVEKEAARKVAS